MREGAVEEDVLADTGGGTGLLGFGMLDGVDGRLPGKVARERKRTRGTDHGLDVRENFFIWQADVCFEEMMDLGRISRAQLSCVPGHVMVFCFFEAMVPLLGCSPSSWQ